MVERLTDNQDYRILIIGCGDLGSRHLQAVARLPGVTEIEVVDPRPEALDLGRKRLTELEDIPRTASIRWFSKLEDATKGGDLCIISTQARGRCQIMRDAAESHGYSLFILEKLVAQSVQEIEDLAGFTETMGLSAWVNCQTRTFPFHQRMKSLLDPQEPMVFSAVGCQQMLATNGIHVADLFAFYDGCRWIEGTQTGNRIDTMLHASKRGDDLFDLTGTLRGYTEKGSTLTISYMPGHSRWEHISVATARHRWIVDHTERWSCESSAESAWAWRMAPFDGNLLVSHTTTGFAADILASRQCGLPSLKESLVAHRFILGQCLPQFCHLLGRQTDVCPVT